jgi:hypothetical protein
MMLWLLNFCIAVIMQYFSLFPFWYNRVCVCVCVCVCVFEYFLLLRSSNNLLILIQFCVNIMSLDFAFLSFLQSKIITTRLYET